MVSMEKEGRGKQGDRKKENSNVVCPDRPGVKTQNKRR
jgi:hypothetical protein